MLCYEKLKVLADTISYIYSTPFTYLNPFIIKKLILLNREFICKLAMAITTIINYKCITMKNLGVFCILLTCIGLQSCKNEQTSKEGETLKGEVEKPISTACYKALYEEDTINLTINTLKNGKITGDMIMKIVDMPEKVGKITGEFRGDTLFADYSFIQGTNDKVTFKNPMAFLKHGNELNLGSGKIETYLGKSYFVKGSPIEFEKVKYKFTTVDCPNK